MSTIATREQSSVYDSTNYGGFVDAIGGIVTIVLAIIALSGIAATMLVAVATIVFGAALLIQGGTMLSEYTHTIFPAGAAAPAEEFGGGGNSTVFLVGAAGIVLGVLALLGLYPVMLTSIAVIAFGSALVLSSSAVWHLFRIRQSQYRSARQPAMMGSEILAGEMASGSAGLQCLAGLGAIVLGILAVTGTNPTILTLVGLLVLGSTVLLTGSTLSGAVQGFMPMTTTRRTSSWYESPAE
jgi:hypothetical protein